MLVGKRVEFDHQIVFQSLEGHTADALRVLRSLLADRPFLEAFCQRWGLPFQKLTEAAFFIVAFHDIGKATKQFQQNIRQGRRSSRYPHPFLALGFFRELCRTCRYEPLLPNVTPENLSYPLVETLAVAAHHTQLYRDIYKEINIPIQWCKELETFLKWLEDLHKEYSFDQLFSLNVSLTPLVERVIKISSRSLETFIHDFCKQDATHFSDKPRLKAIYTFLLSLLKTSDIVASAHFDRFCRQYPEDAEWWGPVLEFSYEWKIPELSENQVLHGASAYPFQLELSNLSKPFVMLLAPCGRGKTEGALLWALSLNKNHQVKRIIFAMPTQVTSNALARRMACLFDKSNVGVYHGRSFSELKAKAEEGEVQMNAQEICEQNFRAEVFWHPVIVTTVDHLLYSFLHGFAQADFALGNLQSAAIVFDEVHYYERRLLSHLKQLFRVLRKMQIPHLLMSGTFPQFLQREIQADSNNAYAFVVDKAGMEYKPFVTIKRDETLVSTVTGENGRYSCSQEFIAEVCEGYDKQLFQFIVLNTIARAKAVYLALSNHILKENLHLLHSQFTYVDRRRKENKVIERLKSGQRPFVLVATQVIEVSLDISADKLFTEVAPADALGQRAGRLNRGGQNPKTRDFIHEFHIFQADSYLPYTEAREVLQRTWLGVPEGSVSYGKIRDWCDQSYEGYQLTASSFQEFFDQNTLFGSPPSEVRFSEEEGRIFRTRESKFAQIDVIPMSVFQSLGEQALQSEYFVSIPYWWYVKSQIENLGLFFIHESENLRRPFLMCRLSYDVEIGFDDSPLRAGEMQLEGVML